MKEIVGDIVALFEGGQFDVIVHGCNCFCTMGAGVAKAVRHKFQAAFDADLATLPGDRGKLGTYTKANIMVGSRSCFIVNAYTQYDWRGRGGES